MPTRDEFLRAVWEQAINPWAGGSWVDALVAEAQSRPGGAFADAGQALARLLDAGSSRHDLASVARAIAYEVTFNLLHMLDDPGVDGGEVFMLHEALLSADPSGREGRPPDQDATPAPSQPAGAVV
ncbi:MAG: hypothetical protein ABGY75_21270 [Gemmataceae bacterium]